MGNNQSAIDPVHLRMYSNIIQIKDPMKRLGIINTCLASMEYVSSAKRAGIYSYLLNYVATVNSGGTALLCSRENNRFHNREDYNNSLHQIPRSMQPNFQHSGGPGAITSHPYESTHRFILYSAISTKTTSPKSDYNSYR